MTLCTGIFLLSCSNSSLEEKLMEIDRISEKWIPDGREGLFDITVDQVNNSTIVLRGETNIPQAKEEVVDYFENSGPALIDSIRILPDTISNERFFGFVTISVANLRKQPDHASELVSQAIMGTPVIVLKSQDSWLLVQTPDKYISWTEESSIKLMNRAERNVWSHSDRVIYLKSSGFIYSSAVGSGIIGDIVAGSLIRNTGKENGYTKVLIPDGREGFVRDKEIADFNLWKSGLNHSGDQVSSVACTFMGFPYLWGGSSTKAVDCSGFVQSVYFMNGIILSRDASLQAGHGSELDISNGFDKLIKGDLLFFGWKNDKGAHVTHVAIYLGNAEYIHSSGRVMINSLDSASNIFNSYRKNSWLSARRMLGTDNDNGIVPVANHEWY